ncbi:MAG: VWA domain-containing protein, partial [Capsulimonadales bacterium]|nr:VWA domain-containing protein [Capsulimonadales bacterium]
MLLSFAPLRAQESSGLDLTAEELAELGEAAGPIRELRPRKNKSVFLIMDVSGSMKGFEMWNRAREATSNILRYGCSVGDTVGLITFGAGYESFVRKIEDGDDRAAVL